jgi:hypothetical protein
VPETLLCDRNPRLSIGGFGDRALLAVRDGASVRFWMDTDLLEAALEGEPIQLSALEGFLHIEVREAWTHLEYALSGQAKRACVFPAVRLAALAILRAERPRDVANPEFVVEDVPS